MTAAEISIMILLWTIIAGHEQTRVRYKIIGASAFTFVLALVLAKMLVT